MHAKRVVSTGRMSIRPPLSAGYASPPESGRRARTMNAAEARKMPLEEKLRNLEELSEAIAREGNWHGSQQSHCQSKEFRREISRAYCACYIVRRCDQRSPNSRREQIPSEVYTQPRTCSPWTGSDASTCSAWRRNACDRVRFRGVGQHDGLAACSGTALRACRVPAATTEPASVSVILQRAPSTARNAVDDLKNLLDAASVEMPVVLVGHSAGGLYAMLFTALYPDRVAGVVLVDPSDPEANNNFALAGHHPPDFVEGTRRQTEANHERLRHCVDLAREGKSDAGQHRSLLPHDGNRPRSQSRVGSAARPASNEGSHTVGDDQPKRAGRRAIQPQRAAVPRGDRQQQLRGATLILLRRGNRVKHPDLPQEIFDKNGVVLLAGHERMAAYSSIGEVRTIPNSGHKFSWTSPKP